MRTILKGSLFDEVPLGTMEPSSAPPQVGDVVECEGKSYTVTDVIEDDPTADGALTIIVEPVAVSQRRGQVQRK